MRGCMYTWFTWQDGGGRNNQWGLFGRLCPRHGDGWAQVQVGDFKFDTFEKQNVAPRFY